MKIMRTMQINEITFDYIEKFNEKEKVVYKENNLKIIYENKETILTKNEIFNIKKDTLYSKRIENNNINDAKDALYNQDNDKYRLYWGKPEDDIEIDYKELIDILDSYKICNLEFNYIAYCDF